MLDSVTSFTKERPTSNDASPLRFFSFFLASFWHAEVDKSGFLKENESVGEYLYTYIYFIYIDKHLYLYPL